MYVYIYRWCIEKVKVTSKGPVAARATTDPAVKLVGARSPSGRLLTRYWLVIRTCSDLLTVQTD